MVFSSIPTYLDPSNWQQQAGGGSIQNHQLITSPPSQSVQQQLSLPPPPAPPQPHGVGGAGSIRPGSMADRARLANIPMPETPLKCPRCDSSNTKFCYFNNYSLSQPRHFCKTCRRYWTRNGALRNVPVGGGCRRNKRSSSKSNSNNNNNNSKSPASSTSTDGRQPTTNSGSTSTISSHSNSYSGPMSGSAASLLGLMTPQIPQLRFMSPLGQLITHDGHHQFSTTSSNNMNLNFSSSGTGESLLMSNNNNLLGGGGGGGGVASILSSGNIEHWRILQQQQQQQQQMATHQFPNFLGGFDPTNPNSSIFPFQGGVHHEGVQFLGESTSHQIRPKISTSMLNQMASVKMEDHNNQDQSTLSRQLSGIPTGNQENWTTNASAWSDLSASFSSSSTSNAL